MVFNEIYSFFSLFGCIGVFMVLSMKKCMREKYDEKEQQKEIPNEDTKLMSIINELQLKSSMNTMDIHKLYIENQELKDKLHRIYTNHLTEDISHYKNITLMNEKLEYMQKYMLNRLHS